MSVPTASQAAIARTCDRIRDMLLAKNQAYGDSALDPLRVFYRASAEEQILVRLDDKLSRLARGSTAGEDVLLDFVGYVVLLIVARERTVEKSTATLTLPNETAFKEEHPDTPKVGDTRGTWQTEDYP